MCRVCLAPCGSNLAPSHVRKHERHPPRVKKKKKGKEIGKKKKGKEIGKKKVCMCVCVGGGGGGRGSSLDSNNFGFI